MRISIDRPEDVRYLNATVADSVAVLDAISYDEDAGTLMIPVEFDRWYDPRYPGFKRPKRRADSAGIEAGYLEIRGATGWQVHGLAAPLPIQEFAHVPGTLTLKCLIEASVEIRVQGIAIELVVPDPGSEGLQRDADKSHGASK